MNIMCIGIVTALSIVGGNALAQSACGLVGTINQRVADCSRTNRGSGDFVLVTRSGEKMEVYLEKSTRLLWSDRLSGPDNHYRALTICTSRLKEIANLANYTWRLPSINEYSIAEWNGIRSALSKMDSWFWSSTVHERPHLAWFYDGRSGRIDFGYREDEYVGYDSIRCVAKI
jgi:hypothetical protein